jgi:hypothetical protein
MYGDEELQRFGREIDDKFYVLSTSKNLKTDVDKTAEINPVVKLWIDHIKADPRCAGTGFKETAISQLIVLIEERLLVITATAKATQSEPDKAADESQAPSKLEEGADSSQFKLGVQEPTALDDQTRKKVISRAEWFANTGKDQRAYAPEVYARIVAIARNADDGIIEWLNPAPDKDKTMSYGGPVVGSTAASRKNQLVSTMILVSFKTVLSSLTNLFSTPCRR